MKCIVVLLALAVFAGCGAAGGSSAEKPTALSDPIGGGENASASGASTAPAPDPCTYFSDSSIERISGEPVERHAHGVDYTLPSECDWVGGETGYPVAIMTINEVPSYLSNSSWEMFRKEGGEPISPPCDDEKGYALPNSVRQQLRCGAGDWEVDLDIPATRGQALSMLEEVLSTLPS